MKLTLKLDAILGPVVVDISFIVILYAKTSLRYADLLIFRDLLTFFLATFFQKEASNDHLTKGNLLN